MWLPCGLTPYLVIYELMLWTVCLVGDNFLPTLNIIKDHIWAKALADSATHGAIGALSWAVCVDLDFRNNYKVLECILAGFLSCAIDLDHFIAAGSFQLKDALSLTNRPVFHDTTIIPAIALLLYFVCYNLNRFYSLPLIFTIAWLSHHLRDGTRRGLWVRPFGSTPPIPYVVYVILVMLLPVTCRIFMTIYGMRMDRYLTKERDIEMNII
ncbi:unnamed protein product [Owenia fusiformis]|uniref:Transmembrane protein 267 n=1 Tax=Owenia fusiformis TaxID=6347 RepID=A0A8S4Q690_OWEFU|nr:unnamed protein product [Owenia fusiformis]